MVEIGRSVERALAVIRAGGLVAIPTETVYGLAADAGNGDALRAVFAAKGRPTDHPLIVHIGDADGLGVWAIDPPPAARVLADACWPGPLTLVLHAAPTVSRVATGGRDTVALRVPAHPLTLELLHRFGGGLAAPSANRFGSVSPTTAAHVVDDLGVAVGYVLDGGPAHVGVESTIVDCTVDPPQVLRPGGIPTEDVERLLGPLAAASGPSRASGMLVSHYAPRAKVVLTDSPDEAKQRAADLQAQGDSVVVIHHGDVVTYAQCLYADLRAGDAAGADVILAVMPPAEGLGHAVRDRLHKAAAAG